MNQQNYSGINYPSICSWWGGYAERIENAAHRATHFNNIKYKAMEDILKKNLDQVSFLDFDTTVVITPNPNVRGSQSYK